MPSGLPLGSCVSLDSADGKISMSPLLSAQCSFSFPGLGGLLFPPTFTADGTMYFYYWIGISSQKNLSAMLGSELVWLSETSFWLQGNTSGRCHRCFPPFNSVTFGANNISAHRSLENLLKGTKRGGTYGELEQSGLNSQKRSNTNSPLFCFL